MAYVTVEGTDRVYRADDEVREFLRGFGIDFEHWSLDSVPRSLLDKAQLTPEDKQALLDSLSGHIDEAKKRAGYQSADVVCLWPEFPNLDKILEPFKREHYHTENEIRFVADGHGTFSINPRDGRPVFHISMQPGELISVPAGTWHWFNLNEDRRIKAVRIFESMEGWEAFYDNPVSSAASA
jgi:1,2-dihydroxy-3-keto-5-methylthiopentene dioxygenase